MLEYLDMLPDQQGIAVPAEAAGAGVELDRLVIAMLGDQARGEGALPAAEAAVRLLQRDDIRIELVQHLQRALGPAAAIGADRLAHIVGGDADHARSLGPRAACAQA